MSFKWDLYLRLADNLLVGGSEAELRSAISRAYYGVFGCARIKVGIEYSPSDDGNVHAEVRNAFMSAPSVSARLVGDLLADMRRSRNLADYDGDQEVNRPLAERVIEKAKKASQTLMSLQI